MEALAISALLGLVLGYFAIGPLDKNYTAVQAGIIIFLLVFLMGLLPLASFLAVAVFKPTASPITTTGILLAAGWWAAYALSLALGTSFYRWRSVGWK